MWFSLKQRLIATKYCSEWISCPHQHFITSVNVKIHSFNVSLQEFVVSFAIPWIFVINNRNGSIYIDTVHQHVQCFDISRGLGYSAQFHFGLSWKLCMYWWRLMTFKRDATMVWWASLDSMVVTEEISNIKYVLRVNYRYVLRTLFLMLLSILWPANISKKRLGCN